jgi:HYR domain
MRRFIPAAVALVVLFGLLTTLAAAAGPADTPSRSQTTTSQLDLHAVLRLVSDLTGTCPPGSPESLECPARTGDGPAPGLGAVTEAYSYFVHPGPPLCSEGNEKVLGYPVRWVVATKGEIEFAVAAAPQCIVASDAVENATQSFTVTGGTGIYAGASGSGTVARAVGLSSVGRTFRGVETWTGTLSVPGLDFDVTAPVLTGVANKTVKAKKGAKSARVTFQVTAQDDRDGALPVACKPRSGSRFPIGRTVVKCAATDSSANTASASFKITVKR